MVKDKGIKSIPIDMLIWTGVGGEAHKASALHKELQVARLSVVHL